MGNNFYVGDVYHSKKKDKIEKTVLYSKDRVMYIDLLKEKEYTTDKSNKDYVIEESLILTDINSFRQDYNYLLYRYYCSNIRSKKKHWYSFKK